MSPPWLAWVHFFGRTERSFLSVGLSIFVKAVLQTVHPGFQVKVKENLFTFLVGFTQKDENEKQKTH